MNIPKYNTFEEKSKHFNIVKIDNIDDFATIYQKQIALKGIYRGVNSSLYKIYTSKQREYFNKSSNKEYLALLKSNKYIQEYFRLANIPKTELSYYSILQHYGKPTPLIDFSNNLSIALFFAMDSIKKTLSNNSTELDNYFSLFFISDSDIELIDASSHLKGVSEYNRQANDYFQNYEDYSSEKILEGTEMLFSINSRKVYFLRQDGSYRKIVNVNNNHRILMQEGVFIFNNLNQYPLEESIKLFLKEEIELSRLSPWDDMDWNRPDVQEALHNDEVYVKKLKTIQKRLNENIITSFEINKRIIKDIGKIVTIPDKDFIYFDINKELDKI
jgi:hypothetical protein